MTEWKTSHPVANREHVCEMCGRTIDKGEKYLRGVGFDGTAWSWKECAHCEAFRNVRPDIYWEDEYCSDSYSEFEPRDWLACVWQMRWKHQWRHGNGLLCAVPA